ncbi:MAG: hypothetical protein QOF09_3210 [Alphaproteobacteria bacterium]|jgi:hypothetical protein|nr:hypothetical protein [Alphaproteobacteria bacterium]
MAGSFQPQPAGVNASAERHRFGSYAMTRWIVVAGALAAVLAAGLEPATAACSSGERRLLPNGKFETVPRQDCYPDLHSAPMSNAPPDMPGMRCRNVQERVLQPDGKFGYRQVERCN